MGFLEGFGVFCIFVQPEPVIVAVDTSDFGGLGDNAKLIKHLYAERQKHHIIDFRSYDMLDY